MMLPTHVTFGLMVTSITLFVAPEVSFIALVAALLGSIFPDLDLVFQHRKTLHFPIYYSALSAALILAAILYPAPALVFIAVFLFNAALHSITDIFGCGLETRPWEATDERAVYDHFHGHWIHPRRWVPYDGSPQDLVLSLAFGAIVYWIHDGIIQQLVLILIGIAAVYAALRKRLADFDERMGNPLPTINGS